ncbi:hypothetical protein [Jeotgalibacillus soli]|uniref:Phosphotyrosine protein phosphatase I domain-containing protein n=1 Tax=Jeotgalibacillus soli TaxID=889306 RepID=A0A0C2VCW0_9BACL|nr:hypothetical protein [Jeotgalibacillus soli]KIL46792.1 hypothetical protein KP78_19100 [Jeotgalibacillus soli]
MANQTVYFLSSNHERSLIAEGWASRLKNDHTTFRSAGWLSAKSSPFGIEAMKEISIDLSTISPHVLNNEELDRADIIVVIQDFENDDLYKLPAHQTHKLLSWHIRNPEKRSENPIEKWVLFQEICEDIAIRIRELERKLNFCH